MPLALTSKQSNYDAQRFKQESSEKQTDRPIDSQMARWTDGCYHCIISRLHDVSQLEIKVVGQTTVQAGECKQTDGRYQVHDLATSPCFTVDNKMHGM